MLLNNREFRFFSLMMVFFLLLPALLSLSDSASDLNLTSKRMIRGSNATRLSNSLLPARSRELVILAPALHGDQIQFKSLKRELFHSDYSTYTFDFSGQGRSFGSMPAGEAGVKQRIEDIRAIEKAIRASGKFTSKNLHYVGYEEGAFAIVAAALTTGIRPTQIVIIKKQSTLSAEEARLIKLLNEQSPQCSVHLVVGHPLSGPTISEVLSLLSAGDDLQSASIPSLYPILRQLAMLLGLLGLILVPAGILFYKKQKSERRPLTRKSVLFHLCIWVGAGVITLEVLWLVSLLPVAIPLAILPYPLLFGSYGLLKVLLYRFAPEKRGLKQFRNQLAAYKPGLMNRAQRLEAFRAGGSMAAFWMISLILIFRLGLYYVIPLNAKQLWFWLLTVITIPGFYSASLEHLYYQMDRISDSLLACIRWFPLFTLPLLLFIPGHSFGLTESLLHLTILVIILLMGRLMLRAKVSPLQTAFSQALLYSLILVPQSALMLLERSSN